MNDLNIRLQPARQMIGSALQGQPANLIPVVASQSGAALIFINTPPTPYDHLVNVYFRESAGKIMIELLSPPP